MLLLLLKVLSVYLLFGVGYSTYKFNKEYKRAYWMLNYVNVPRPRLVIFGRYLLNVIGWLPKVVLEIIKFN